MMRRSAVLEAFALGDAWGYVTEFMSYDHIQRTKPPVPDTLVVSDDTQMSLYTMYAIADVQDQVQNIAWNPAAHDPVRRAFAEQYMSFYHDVDNTRAPGITCMNALQQYGVSDRVTGDEGGQNDSLGCGTIMRSPWVGLLPISRADMVTLNILQSQTTHGDARGWIVSALNGVLIHNLLTDRLDVDTPLFPAAIDTLREILSWGLPVMEGLTPACDAVLAELTTFVDTWEQIRATLSDPAVDVNTVFGEGWIATESLYNALGVVSLYNTADSAWDGLQRLVYSAGDSDSTAALCAALYAARFGASWYTVNVSERLEPRYRDELHELTAAIEGMDA